MPAHSEKQELQNWRNWALRVVTGAAVLLDKMELHCPDVIEQAEICKESMRVLEAKLRAGQPEGSKGPKRNKMKTKRIWVR